MKTTTWHVIDFAAVTMEMLLGTTGHDTVWHVSVPSRHWQADGCYIDLLAAADAGLRSSLFLRYQRHYRSKVGAVNKGRVGSSC